MKVINVINVIIELSEELSAQQKDNFWDNFISQAIEANNLQYGGLTHGVIESNGEFEINENHKQKVTGWLESQKDVQNYDLQLINDNT